jgi:hypothetical protein
MNNCSDSTDRRPSEYVRFAIGFLAFGMAATGVVLTTPPLAVLGALTLLGVVASFRSSPET